MFEQSLGLRENPFVAGHQPRFVYPSREHQEALAHLRFGIENREPFVLITGEVGTGKTTAIYDALSGWGTRAVVALITNSALTRAELIEEIALRFGLALTPGMTKPQALVLLERHLRAVMARQEMAILLLDEAQNLERELLEEIRLLSNLEHDGQKLLQIFLVGQPELEVKLTQPELRQLRQRIAVHYRLQPMTAEETAHYLHHRIAVAGGNAHQLFPAETCGEVYRLTHGIPREINTVASQALLNAYVDDSHVVHPRHVTAVARETGFRSVIDVHGPQPSVAAAAAPSLSPPPDHEATRPVVLQAATPAPPSPPVIPAAAVPAPPVARPEPPVVMPAAAWTPPAAPESEVVIESFEVEEPAPPRFEGPPRLPEFEPLTDDVRTPTTEEMEAMLAEAISPWAGGDRTEPTTKTEADIETDAVIEAEAELEAENEPESELLPAADVPAGDAIPMPDWLEEAISKHRPSDATSWAAPVAVPAAMAPAASGVEAPPGSVPSFLPGPREAEPETIVAARPSFADALARERERAAEAEAEAEVEAETEIEAVDESLPEVTPRTARILPMRGPSTGLEPEFLSSRLREKLEAEDQPRRRANVLWILATIFAVAAVVSIALAIRFGVIGGKGAADATDAVPAVTQKTTPKPTEPVAEPAPAPAAVAPAESVATAPAAPSADIGATVPASGVPAAGLGLAGEPAPKPTSPAPGAPAPRRIYGIAVGTYFDRDRALQEAERVAASLNLAARYMPVSEDGTPMFRAVVGRFSDRAEAERIAGALTGRGLANEGRVVLIGTIP